MGCTGRIEKELDIKKLKITKRRGISRMTVVMIDVVVEREAKENGKGRKRRQWVSSCVGSRGSCGRFGIDESRSEQVEVWPGTVTVWALRSGQSIPLTPSMATRGSLPYIAPKLPKHRQGISPGLHSPGILIFLERKERS